jgi:hypothetical protein
VAEEADADASALDAGGGDDPPHPAKISASTPMSPVAVASFIGTNAARGCGKKPDRRQAHLHARTTGRVVQRRAPPSKSGELCPVQHVAEGTLHFHMTAVSKFAGA